MDKRFNIRVYGLLQNGAGDFLITHETYSDIQMTKFPGGGLEWGEGMIDALKREFMEELEADVEVGDLFYFTDYFQVSAFRPTDQLFSVYYWIRYQNPTFPTQGSFNRGKIRFEWIPLDKLNKELFTFPIDQLVAEKIRVYSKRF